MKGSAQTKLLSGTVRTPFGGVKVSKGLPANAAEVNKLFDQLDFQQATQAYLWALPLVSFAEWQATHDEVFGATNHDIVLYANYADRLGILTANATTPYMMAFVNLKKSGPMVIELPPGPVAGGLGDFWQREGAVLGEMGPDKGAGGKTLILGPGDARPRMPPAIAWSRAPRSISFLGCARSIRIRPRPWRSLNRSASIPTPHGPTRRRRASSRPAGRSGSAARRAAWSIGSACIR